ncbi:hypothetical protein ETB97_008861 [Aspergillus alliaceus]|uniref:Formamidase n=1 Tax=Petromyces alliaceus TaxID=209559 RepID=A0A8H5ZSP3_PETAA|nr:hypothetical protein ETB97_008861 [Aspergillus burnettii]
MPSQVLPTVISIDVNQPPEVQPGVHNRWHPDIPAATVVQLDQEFKVECHDFAGGLIGNNDVADDADEFDWNRDHCLSGPIRVDTAEPGDVLRVDILDIQPFPNRPWGFSFVKPVWDFHGANTSSRHLQGVSFTGRPHCGTIGTAPSWDMLQQWTERERALNVTYSTHGVTCAHMPSAHGAYIGQKLPRELHTRIVREGARTTPARENGGNIDYASLSHGSTIFLPVFVPGANLSIGDLHFSQGDGEPTCAIEMAGIATLRCSVLRNGMQTLGIDGPMLMPGLAGARYQQQLVFHGLSLDQDGLVQRKNDSTAAYIQAARRAIAWLGRFGYSLEQAITILAIAPIEARILATANIPTVNVSIGLPTGIFCSDITPAAPEPVFQNRGSAAYLSEARQQILSLGTENNGVPSVYDIGD